MMKNDKSKLIISSAVILMPALYGVLMWDKLPARIPTHFDVNGNVDATSSKAFTVFFIPVFLLLLHLFCIYATKNDPKQKSISEKIFSLLYAICPSISILCYVLIYSYAFGVKVPVNVWASFFTGGLFIVVGNYLPKCRLNYTVGIKIPWTLASIENWNNTHRFAGRVWVAGGLFILASGIGNNIFIMLASALITAFLPIIYSFMYFRKYEQGEQQ